MTIESPPLSPVARLSPLVALIGGGLALLAAIEERAHFTDQEVYSTFAEAAQSWNVMVYRRDVLLFGLALGLAAALVALKTRRDRLRRFAPIGCVLAVAAFVVWSMLSPPGVLCL